MSDLLLRPPPGGLDWLTAQVLENFSNPRRGDPRWGGLNLLNFQNSGKKKGCYPPHISQGIYSSQQITRGTQCP